MFLHMEKLENNIGDDKINDDFNISDVSQLLPQQHQHLRSKLTQTNVSLFIPKTFFSSITDSKIRQKKWPRSQEDDGVLLCENDSLPQHQHHHHYQKHFLSNFLSKGSPKNIHVNTTTNATTTHATTTHATTTHVTSQQTASTATHPSNGPVSKVKNCKLLVQRGGSSYPNGKRIRMPFFLFSSFPYFNKHGGKTASRMFGLSWRDRECRLLEKDGKKRKKKVLVVKKVAGQLCNLLKSRACLFSIYVLLVLAFLTSFVCLVLMCGLVVDPYIQALSFKPATCRTIEVKTTKQQSFCNCATNCKRHCLKIKVQFSEQQSSKHYTAILYEDEGALYKQCSIYPRCPPMDADRISTFEQTIGRLGHEFQCWANTKNLKKAEVILRKRFRFDHVIHGIGWSALAFILSTTMLTVFLRRKDCKDSCIRTT